MARTVWSRALMLHACPLTEADRQGRNTQVKQRFFPNITYPLGPSIALRWMSRPLIGFPRKPFSVYRRLRTGDDLNLYGRLLATSAFSVPANTRWTWGFDTLFDVALQVTVPAGASLTVVARDTYGEPLPGQRITFSGSGWGRFRAHGIASLGFSGTGTVNTLVGIPQETYVNLSSWGQQPIQVVGLPYKAGAATLPVYDGAMLQGYAPASMTGYDAAQRRLEIAAMMQLDPPPIPGVAVSPAWPAPDAVRFLQEMVDGRTGAGGRSFFQAVRQCLSQTVDSDPTKQQRDYVTTHELDGLVQVGQNVPPEGQTTFRLPVVATTMMNVATDSFAATGLGYGTLDLPPTATVSSPKGGGLGLQLPSTYLRPTGIADLPHDYMVTAPFHVLTQMIGSKMEWDVELAAIAEVRPEPSPAQSLSASLLSRDRPPSRDTQSYESRKLEWLPSLLPQSYGVAVERPGSSAAYLNAPRLGGKGYQPFVPSRPGTVEGEVEAGSRSHYVDRHGRQPFSGSATSRYSLIATDAFGRWSNWVQTSFSSSADAVAKPGLDKVAFEPNAGATGASLPGKWVVDFAWDWGDRSPHTIEITGRFFPGEGVDPDPAPPSGFALTPSSAGTPVLIRFNASQQPYIASAGHSGNVQVLGAVSDSSSDVRRYRLILDNGSVAFTATQKKVGFAAHARGSEAVRPAPPAAGSWSGPVGPRVTYVFDPTPPVVSFTPPQVKWTSLPDVTGRARARLTWDGDASAEGYILWMATESALAKKANLVMPEDIQERALLLKNTVRTAALAGDEDSIRVFTRLNDKPLKDESFEVDLPGQSGMLYLYRISAISKNAVESTRSSEMYAVGVPGRVQPGQPVLTARSDAATGGIRLNVYPGPGPEADGFRLYRVRREVQARDVGMMGPAVYGHTAPQWQTELVPRSLGSSELVESTVLVDPQAPSWFPFYYRAQAVGGTHPDDPVLHGRYRGESEASSVVEVLHTPPGPPALDFVGDPWVDANDRINVFTFLTDLPHRLSPLGVARIELYEMSVSAKGAPERKKVLDVKTHELTAQGAIPNPDAMVNAVVQAGQVLRFFHSPNGGVPAQYRLYVKLFGKTETAFDPVTQQPYQRPIIGAPRILRLVDPLGRATEVPLEQWFHGTF